MGGQYGVKETKEAMIAVFVLGGFVASRVKDGVDLGDAMALGQKLMLDAEFKAVVMAGVEGMELVGKEITELDVQDYIELAKVVPVLLEKAQAFMAAKAA